MWVEKDLSTCKQSPDLKHEGKLGKINFSMEQPIIEAMEGKNNIYRKS